MNHEPTIKNIISIDNNDNNLNIFKILSLISKKRSDDSKIMKILAAIKKWRVCIFVDLSQLKFLYAVQLLTMTTLDYGNWTKPNYSGGKWISTIYSTQ